MGVDIKNFLTIFYPYQYITGRVFVGAHSSIIMHHMFIEAHTPVRFRITPSLHVEEDEEDEESDTIDFEDEDLNEDINDDRKFKDEFDLIDDGTGGDEEEEAEEEDPIDDGRSEFGDGREE